MPHDVLDPLPPCCEGKTLFESAVEIVEYYKGWIDWGDPTEVIQKPICCAMGILETGGLGGLVPEVYEYLRTRATRKAKSRDDYIDFWRHYGEVRSVAVDQLSKFILEPDIEKESIRQGKSRYYDAQVALCLVDFFLIHRPCCRLLQIAWLIPWIARGIPAIPLVSYAAEQLADFTNDPVEPLSLDCTTVGNSWFHRLGVYLLHQCRANSLPPDPRLIRLISLVSLPPSASVKRGKATRYSDGLAHAKTPQCLHEATAAQAIGTALALELMGEFDANRQGEHFRRIERAVAFYAHALLNAGKPSIKSIQHASGLSWADANKLVSRPFFSRLVFEYQCRYLVVEPCPECDEVGRALKEKAEQTGQSMLSSVSSW